jgi:hypothetical protein
MSDLLNKMPNVYEPLRKNRFIFRFPADLGIQEWWVATAGRPQVTISKQEIPFLNTKTYVAGSYAWNPIQITLRDPIGPSASQAMMEWVRLHAESVTGRMGYAAGYMRDIEIEMLDPVGVTVSKWTCKNCMLDNVVNFGDLNYASPELVNITFSVQPQYCILAY